MADDYVLDHAPTEMIDWNAEKYEPAQDKEVCSLYLQNLRYFVRRQIPMSCNQPVAPMLEQKIHKAEWENLDPEKYSDLFKAVVKNAWYFDQTEPPEDELAAIKKEIEQGSIVFRKLKFELKGYPAFIGQKNVSQTAETFNIVQYGKNVTDPQNPQPAWRCNSRQGRIMDSVHNFELRLYVVTNKLDQIYDSLTDWRGNSGQNLWLINNEIYAELYTQEGDVKLSELRLHDPIHLEPVCLYHYRKTVHHKE
jgi:hypothetical protein